MSGTMSGAMSSAMSSDISRWRLRPEFASGEVAAADASG